MKSILSVGLDKLCIICGPERTLDYPRGWIKSVLSVGLDKSCIIRGAG